MKLLIKDRINLMQILPGEGSIKTIATAIAAHTLLDLTPKEIEKHEYHIDDKGLLHWKDDKETEIDLKLDQLSLIKEEIERLDKEEKITRFQYSTFIKIKEL